MKRTILFFFFVIPLSVFAQDLDALLGDDNDSEYLPIEATFKATRIINSQSVETVAKNNLLFVIMHRFGELNDGFGNFYGLDHSVIRFGFEYGITDRFTTSLGRSSSEKLYDGFLKYKLVQQTPKMPISIVALAGSGLNTSLLQQTEQILGYKPSLTHSMAYYYQLLVARKFSNAFSVQFLPTLLHRNVVPTTQDSNNMFALGAGFRIKLTNRLTFNVEGIYIANPYSSTKYYAPISVGFDIERGGHVFHLNLTNSTGMYEGQFIGKTDASWTDGGIRMGFNINRIFDLN